MTDHDLLQHYARENSQAAFAELLARHLNLVYSAARRQVRAPQLAEDIAQSVFLDLARHAPDFPADQPLAAWLHVVTRRTAIDTIRRESRRAAREHTAALLATHDLAASTPMHPTSDASPWSAIEPLLDEAVAALPAPDRHAILLRYFENKSLREIGTALGTTDDAAQKRVSRALDQLRTLLARRGLTLTAAGLASNLSAHAILTAPATLTGTIAAATAALGTSAVGVAVHTVVMTTLQKSLVTAAFALVVSAGIYETRLLARQSAETADLLAQIERTQREHRQLRVTDASVTAKLKDIERQIDARLAAALPVNPVDTALDSQMQEWLGQIDRMKEFLAQRPQWNIPELALLSDEQWFKAAATDRFETEEQFRRATSRLRDLAVSLAAGRISRALRAYVSANDDRLPETALALAPHLDPPLDEAILARYRVLMTGKASDVPTSQVMHILEPLAPADIEFDAYNYIGLRGHGNSGAAINTNLRDAQRQFGRSHNGERATSAEQLLPYLKWPVEAALLEKYLNPPAGSSPR